ncbi:MAG: hypothetical protein QOH48_1395 [Actinomycetota bacterium]|nr:hypothetical protein [Actinomycetota bacterium]
MTAEVDARSVEKWVAGYEQLWRTAGTARLKELFDEDATYQHSPYERPFIGLAAIAEMWDAERKGPDEIFSMTTSIVARQGETAVVRAEVSYGDPVEQEYRDLWSSGTRRMVVAAALKSGRSGPTRDQLRPTRATRNPSDRR